MGETKTTQGRSPGDLHPILQSADDIFELAVKLGLFFFLVYWSTVLLRPFLSIALLSLILTVTLYPAFSWTARLLGGRRKLAAFLVTAISLLVFTGPIIWLGMSMIEGMAELSHRLSAGDIAIPPPSERVKQWPFIGERLFYFWDLAFTNLKSPDRGSVNPSPLGDRMPSIRGWKIISGAVTRCGTANIIWSG
jgi:predicted PurR-regulated permease PerM